MPKLDQVIYDIERCTCHVPDACQDCSKYRGEYTPDCMEQLLTDALKLLKEQRIAMKPKNIDKIGGNCPICGLRMARNHKYCYQCGQEINWNV